MRTHKSIIAILLFIVAVIAVTPCLAKEKKDTAPESVRFWVSPDGDVFVEETRRVGGFFSKVKNESSGVLLRLRWPATVLWEGLPDEPVLDNLHGSAHFIGGERLFAVTSQLSGDDDYRVLFWDGIQGIWRLLAPLATLDPVRGVFRTTLGPKLWVSLASPDDGVRVCGFVLDDYLADVKRKLCIDCPDPRRPTEVVQSADGRFMGIVMLPQEPTVSQRSRMTEEEVKAQRGKVELAVFDVSGTEPTVKVSGVESLKVGEQEPSSIAAVGDTFVCGFFGAKLRLLGFKLSDGKLGKAGPEFTIARLALGSMVDLSPSIHGDGFMLLDCDGAKVMVRKLSPAMAQVGEWALDIPKEAEAPIKQLVFNEKMAFLHLSDSKGKIIVCTTAGSTDVLWPREKKRGAR
ncbi:MAG: hypothetical protein JW759_09200 [Candidatus Coatesbacteria bacterium]|nr:hypothetical protein [Candidatus Coatesbacteria bacterium]